MLDQSKTPGAQPAPKPGPKPGPKAAAKFEAPPQELIGRLWSGCFEIVAARGGAHWKLTGEESGWLGQASHDALNRYGPGLSKHIEAVVLAIAILAVFAPRVAYQISAAKKAAKSKPTKAD